MRYANFAKKCVELLLPIGVLPIWASFARIQLDDGSSFPITPQFNQIQMLTNEPERKVVLASSEQVPEAFMLMLTDQRLAVRDFQPEAELRSILGYPDLTLVPIPTSRSDDFIQDNWFLVSGAETISGSLMTYGLRRLHRGLVVFFLVGRDDSFQETESTFWKLVNEFKPPPYTHVPFQKINRPLLFLAFVILGVNIRVLWGAFKWYATLSPQATESLDTRF